MLNILIFLYFSVLHVLLFICTIFLSRSVVILVFCLWSYKREVWLAIKSGSCSSSLFLLFRCVSSYCWSPAFVSVFSISDYRTAVYCSCLISIVLIGVRCSQCSLNKNLHIWTQSWYFTYQHADNPIIGTYLCTTIEKYIIEQKVNMHFYFDLKVQI